LDPDLLLDPDLIGLVDPDPDLGPKEGNNEEHFKELNSEYVLSGGSV
jgi:hypothetical protein